MELRDCKGKKADSEFCRKVLNSDPFNEFSKSAKIALVLSLDQLGAGTDGGSSV